MSRSKRRSGRRAEHRGQTPTHTANLAHSASPTAAQTAPLAKPQVEASAAQEATPGPLRPLRKDQARALDAYKWAEEAKARDALEDYEIAVQSFAAVLLRSGLAAAVSVLERSKERDGFKLLLSNLASRPLPGIPQIPAEEWPPRVRALADASLYMQATRELVAFLGWLRRACRALGAEGGS